MIADGIDSLQDSVSNIHLCVSVHPLGGGPSYNGLVLCDIDGSHEIAFCMQVSSAHSLLSTRQAVPRPCSALFCIIVGSLHVSLMRRKLCTPC